jgi:hypothetical protein
MASIEEMEIANHAARSFHRVIALNIFHTRAPTCVRLQACPKFEFIDTQFSLSVSLWIAAASV